MASVSKVISQTGVGISLRRIGSRFRPLPLSSSHQLYTDACRRDISSTSRAMKVLSESTTIIQDGTTIQELPILIQHATRDTYPFTSHTYSGERMREDNDFDTGFKEMLQDCNSVSDVFNLLEVPSDRVQGHSAVYALQRLHVLMSLNTDWKQIHSFIRRAVIGELYQIVERDIRLLSNFSLISLIDCFFAAKGFSATCFEAVHEQISHRLVEGMFSVEELLSLIQSLKTGVFQVRDYDIRPLGLNLPANNIKALKSVLSDNASVFLSDDKESTSSEKSLGMPTRAQGYEQCSELLRNSWIHLLSRMCDLDENTLPWTMQLLPPSHKSLVPLLDKQLSRVWPHLNAQTAAMCLDNLSRLRVHSASMMTKLGQWAFVNIHLMTPAVLLSFLHVFQHFLFFDRNMIGVMERCVAKTGTDTPTDLLALCLEYLRSNKFVSPVLMDVAASHFTLHWESYSPLEIFAVLRCYGQLAYLPSNPKDFLYKTEMCLDKRFDQMDEAHLLEVLASFTFLNVLPRNFYKRVTCEYFYKKVGALKNPSRTSALMWLKVMKHAVVFGSGHVSTDKTGPSPQNLEKHLQWVLNRKKRWSIYLFHDKEKVAVLNLKQALDELFGPEYHHVIPFYSCCAIYLDRHGIPLRLTQGDGYPKPDGEIARRVVILLRAANHFTANTRQLLGAQQQRMAHLRRLGFHTLEIRAGEFHCQPGAKVLKQHLTFVNFNDPKVKELGQKRMEALEKRYLKKWMESDEDVTDDGQSDDSDDGEFLSTTCLRGGEEEMGFSVPADGKDSDGEH